MTQDNQLPFCGKCLNRKMDSKQGLICNPTNEKTTFENECENFKLDKTVENIRQDNIKVGRPILFLGFTALSIFVSAFIILVDLSLVNYDLGLQNERANNFMMIFGFGAEIAFSLGFLTLGILTIISFCKYKSNAVALGKSYYIILIISNLVFVLGFLFDPSAQLETRILISLVWGFFWFFYLRNSEQINFLFPKQERRMYKRDKVFLISIFVPIVIWFLSIFVVVFFEDFHDEISNEKWTYTIVVDTLTLDSQQVEDVKFRYVFGGVLVHGEVPIDTPAEHAGRLVGTWFWDEDHSYTLVFNADGSGLRGWYPEYWDAFTWSTSGDTLNIIVVW